jgi:hypothetical protein
MANTKKTTSTTEEKVAKINNTADIKSLEKQVQEQQEQIKQLMEMLRNNVAVPVTTESNDVGADEEILVISLTPNKLNLVGNDGSVLFAFDNMYEEQYIDYASLKEIVRANRDMAKSGRFYILDERVVNKLRLKNNYKNILTPEQLKKLFAVSADKAIDLYNLANDMQRQTIIELVKQAKFNSENVDYNLLQKLSELSGIDLMNVEDATQIDVTK